MLRQLVHAIRGVAVGARHLMLLAVPAGLAAQSAPLTLADVVQRMERTNPMLAAARATADAARARVGPATALPDPRAQFAVMNRMLPGLTTMSPLAMDQLTVTQMLPLATRRASAQAATARARVTAASINIQRFMLRRDAAIMLADWWQADASRAVMDETRLLLRETIAAGEAMYRSGSGSQADVLRMQAELTRMTAEWMRMDAMRRSAAASLSVMLDAAIDPDSVKAQLPEALDASAPARDDVSSPSLVVAQLAVDASRAEEGVARGMRWPELEVGVQLGQRPGTSERMVGVMAGASLPLFARQRQQQMIQEAAAMRRMAEAEARNSAAENRADIAEANAAMARSRALLGLYDTTLLPQLQAVRESAEAAYRAGTGGLEAVLNAVMAVNDARLARVTARADEVRALARLEPLTGRAWLAAPLQTERVP
jgi:outer membrane protein TolC